MAFPAGVTTRNIVFSGVTDAEDNAPAAYSARASIVCNDPLIHIPTGVQLFPSAQIRNSGFVLPITDQAGMIWGDGKGNYYDTSKGYHSHSYWVELEYQISASSPWIPYRTIPKLLVPAGAGDLDLDTVISPATFYAV